jgi:rubredoxin
MAKFRCTICDFVYDEAAGGVELPELPCDWVCPVCGAPKDMFEELP